MKAFVSVLLRCTTGIRIGAPGIWATRTARLISMRRFLESRVSIRCFPFDDTGTRLPGLQCQVLVLKTRCGTVHEFGNMWVRLIAWEFRAGPYPDRGLPVSLGLNSTPTAVYLDPCPTPITFLAPHSRRHERQKKWKTGRCRFAKVRRGRSGITPMISNVVPNSIQDALGMFMQPLKSEDPRLDFYSMYKREAIEYDNNYVRKYDEDLNITLIFVCLSRDTGSIYR